MMKWRRLAPRHESQAMLVELRTLFLSAPFFVGDVLEQYETSSRV
ncbi:MAG: hypothetical protein QOF90_862 [Acetobacteraceae bacterium]|jgi:hypothetical protein|nr:hypothetical protein [Acetobacteraceae bacterium]MEA2790870.1 hypothetical protein [Acetobacteraceae bacterium]